MIEVVAISVLVLMNLAQGYVIFRLIDRLMSRNYYDFKTTENITPPKPSSPVVQEEETEEDLGYLSGI